MLLSIIPESSGNVKKMRGSDIKSPCCDMKMPICDMKSPCCDIKTGCCCSVYMSSAKRMGGKAQPIHRLLRIGRHKAQMAIDLHRIGRGIHGKLLPLVVLPHGLEQGTADPPAVIRRPDEKAADVLRLAHTQRTHQFIAVKCAIKPQRPDALRVMQTGAEKVNALPRILRGFKLLKNLPRQLQSSRDFFAAQAANDEI